MATLNPAYDRTNPLLQGMEIIDGRVHTKYVPEVAFRVCEMIAEGLTFDKIFSEENRGIVCKQTTFFYWVMNNGECKRAFLAAQQISAFVMEDLAVQTAQAISLAPGSPQRVAAYRALIDQYRWSSGRRNPAMFSEKAAVQVTVPIQINTGLDMGDGRGERLPEVSGGENVYALEAHTVKMENIQTGQDIVDAQNEMIEQRQLVKPRKLSDPAHGKKVREAAAAAQWGYKRKLTPRGPKKGTVNDG